MENQVALKSEQEHFDAVYAHFKTMPGPASHVGTVVCCYRMQDGNACFAGGLIPDADYRPEMEGKWCGSYEVYGTLRRQGFHPSWIWDYQRIHDNAVKEADGYDQEDRARVWRRAAATGLLWYAEDKGLKIDPELVAMANVDLDIEES